jgi:hypothetical protein
MLVSIAISKMFVPTANRGSPSELNMKIPTSSATLMRASRVASRLRQVIARDASAGAMLASRRAGSALMSVAVYGSAGDELAAQGWSEEMTRSHQGVPT